MDRSVPVHVAGDQLAAGIDGRRYHGNAGHLALDCFQIIDGQSVRAGIAGAAADTADVLCARRYEQKVRADAVDLGLDRCLCALANADHSDHRRDTNNDAEHGERRAHLVALQCPKSYSNDI